MADDSSVERDFLLELINDVAEADAIVRNAASPAARRAYTCAVFAAIEGTSNHLKAQVLDDEWQQPGDLSMAEVAMLREEVYAVNQKGRGIRTASFHQDRG